MRITFPPTKFQFLPDRRVYTPLASSVTTPLCNTFSTWRLWYWSSYAMRYRRANNPEPCSSSQSWKFFSDTFFVDCYFNLFVFYSFLSPALQVRRHLVIARQNFFYLIYYMKIQQIKIIKINIHAIKYTPDQNPT